MVIDAPVMQFAAKVQLVQATSAWRTSPRAYVIAALVAAIAGFAVATYPVLAAVIPCGILAGAVVAYFFRDPAGVLIGFFVYEVVQTALAALAGYSGTLGRIILHADEAMILALLVLSIILRWAKPSGVKFGRYVAAGVVFAVAGLVSAFHEHVPTSVALVGTWLQMKWWVLLAVGLLVPWSEGDKARVIKVLMRAGLVLSALGFIDLVARQPFRALLRTDKVSLTFDPRAGHAVESIFTTPAQFSIVMAMLMTVALAARLTGARGRYGLYALLFAAMTILSLRVSGLVAVVIAGFAVWLIGSRSFGSRAVAIVSVLLGALILFTLFKSEISSHITTYSTTNTNARALLYTTSKTIADRYAPLGSGFGTFASAESRLHYSPLYQRYGLEATYGLSKRYPQFIDDTMWPAILGEAGYIGLAAVAVGFIVLAVALLRRITSSSGAVKLFPLAAFGVILVALTNSAANPVMFNGLNSVIVALLAGPALVLAPRRDKSMT